ncbi:MAG: hypothetical protein JXR86_04765 [Spirochaetales bacterium]|nr:hypothetical protein [Spirochaetales bacterium]
MITLFTNWYKTIVLTVVLATVSAALSADDLWDKAIDVALNNRTWLAKRTVIDARQLNSREQVVGEGRTVIVRTIGSSGMIDTQVEQSGDNPPDPQNVLSKGLGSPSGSERLGNMLEIFEENLKDELNLRRSSRTDSFSGSIRAAIYDFRRVTPDGGVVTGQVWIDVRSGVPVKIQWSVENPPSPLKEIRSEMLLNSDPYAWYPLSVRTDSTAQRGLIKRQIELNITLQGYSLYPKN